MISDKATFSWIGMYLRKFGKRFTVFKSEVVVFKQANYSDGKRKTK